MKKPTFQELDTSIKDYIDTTASDVSDKLGSLPNLTTTSKLTLVEAINEVNSKEVDLSPYATKTEVSDVDDKISLLSTVASSGSYNDLVDTPDLSPYATVSQLNAKTPVLKGKSNFNSTTGKIVSHSIGHTNYYVEVTPSQNPNGYLGEWWVEYSSTSFKVCCGGTATTEFRYVVYA